MIVHCRAVLFDSDGVLVDSDASVARAWQRWADEYGVPGDVASQVHGRRSKDTVAALIEAQDQSRALADIDRYEVEDAALVTAIAGAPALVASIPPDRFAVVTSALGRLVRARLAGAGIAHPDVIVAADDVARGKPAPDGYLAAAAALNCYPHDCVVVEDSVSGVAAARAAGVGAVIGVGARALETDADVVVPDLRSVSWTEAGCVIHEARTLRPAAPSKA